MKRLILVLLLLAMAVPCMSASMRQTIDSAADWTSNNPTLPAGQMGVESDTDKFKFGDGSTAWTSLPYANTNPTATQTVTNKTIDNDDNTLTDMPVEICFAMSDETTDLTVADDKVTLRAPWAFTLTAVRASVATAPTGTGITVDIEESGTTVFSTLLTIDATEKTSTTAATAAVISDSVIADDAEISANVDVVGSTVAGAGLKVCLYGKRDF